MMQLYTNVEDNRGRNYNIENSRRGETAGRQYAVLRECESAVHGAGAAKPRHATPRRTHSRTASHATHNTSTNNVQASICCYREGHAVAIGKQQLVLSWWSYVVRAKESVPFRKAKRRGTVVRERGQNWLRA